MSHVAAVECRVQDLDVLKDVAERLGFEFREGQKTYRWFGQFLNDWHSARAAVRKGFDSSKFGKCEHALRLKGQPGAYEIGVTAHDDGEGYDLIYDTFGGGGAPIERLAGVDLVTLRNELAAETVVRTLRGYRFVREQTATGLRIRATA